jgi:hypothetical protein
MRTFPRHDARWGEEELMSRQNQQQTKDAQRIRFEAQQALSVELKEGMLKLFKGKSLQAVRDALNEMLSLTRAMENVEGYRTTFKSPEL